MGVTILLHVCHHAQVCLPSEPRQLQGQYWGYSTRIAGGLAEALDSCPFGGAYDVRIGTSERGAVFGGPGAAVTKLPAFKHALLVFGGPLGLEACAAKDPSLAACDSVEGLFDLYLNTCPQQGSRTIRTEEAVLISLGMLQHALRQAGE